MLQTMASWWLQWLFGLIATGLIVLCRQLRKRQRATEMGIQALLRDRLVVAYYHYKEKEYITLHGLEAIESMYQEYHNLGGNGTVTKLVNDMRKMEVRDEGKEGT